MILSIAGVCGWLIVCAGQAVLAKFAETYFKNKLQAGTPFTFGGAKELLRLGVLTLVIPTGCSVLGSIAEGIAAGFWNAEKAAALDLSFDNGASIVLGVMFLPGSLPCRYGAELTQQDA
ncbi:MAG: hypothetical protein ACLSCX_06990 [Oscillospiraceae bacterium]